MGCLTDCLYSICSDVFNYSLDQQRHEDCGRFNDSSYMYALRHTVTHMCQSLTLSKDGPIALEKASVHGSGGASIRSIGLSSALKGLLLNVSVWEAAHGKKNVVQVATCMRGTKECSTLVLEQISTEGVFHAGSRTYLFCSTQLWKGLCFLIPCISFK